MSRGPRRAPQPVDWAAAQHQTGPAAPLLHCQCGGYWLDDEPGRHAHRVVFLHSSSPREAPARESAQPEGDTS